MNGCDARAIHETVRAKYRLFAAKPEGHFSYPTGRRGALAQGYDPAWLDAAPPEVVERFVGVGNPFEVRRPVPGDRVLDVGCGAGLDAFVAAGLVGPSGRVVGVELTQEMLDTPRAALAARPMTQLAFEEADAAALPFPDASFDVVVSNGVLNLVPDKDAAFREIRRVLRPGGTLAAADLVVLDAIPAEQLASKDAWSS
jgi:arsenite methyltransferase